MTLAETGPAAFRASAPPKRLRPKKRSSTATAASAAARSSLVIQDDQTNPQVEVQLVSGYLAKKPSIIIGGMFAAMCLADQALLSKDNGPVLFCFSPAVHPPPGSWVYSGSFTTLDLYQSALRYFHAKGLNKIGLLTTLDANRSRCRQLDPAAARPGRE